MIAKESFLVLERFDILKSSCQCEFDDDQNVDLLDITQKYPVDIDFKIQTDNKGSFLIFVKVDINAGDKIKSGYSISAEGVGLFSLSQEAPQDKVQGYVNSGVNICITNLRAYINTMTSFYPLGRFSFHSIDMPALFKSKEEEMNSKG
ncbi:hypothetical protein FQ707_01980 [Bacteroidaceae bacterium HV4-6-C5C]|nr:hypothetical protein FQ707_01980 [Bacteroidaceae bacterium HV4-6-C5C]